MEIIGNDSVASYLVSFSKEDQEVLNFVRDKINKVIDKKYDETFNRGMICWEVPMKVYPHTNNKKPLMFLALGRKKNYFALHCMVIHNKNPETRNILEAGYERINKKSDIGQGCIKFKNTNEIPWDEMQQIIKMYPVDTYISLYDKIWKTGK